MKRLRSWALLIVLIVVGVALYLLSLSTTRSVVFGRWQLWLIGANIGVGLLLIGLIAANLYRLYRALRQDAPGARLTRRLVALFGVLAVLPVGAVFYFSLQFIDHGIDSWFNLNLDRALGDALMLSRRALTSQTGLYAGASAQAARMLADRGPEPIGPALDRLRKELGAVRVGIFDTVNGREALSHNGPRAPVLPSFREGKSTYPMIPSARLYVPGNGNLYVLARAPIPGKAGRRRWFEALYPVGGQASKLARRVEAGYSRYHELNYLRRPLKLSFALTLTLVLLLSLLVAVWAAFFAARRVVEPIQELAYATRAVAAGDFAVKVPEHSRDEIGFLTRAFNRMTARLALARAEARQGEITLERERTWLATVFGALPTGVITLDPADNLRSINTAAAVMLELVPKRWQGVPLGDLLNQRTELKPLFERGHHAVRRDLEVRLSRGMCTLRVGSTEIADTRTRISGGWVLVVEDVSEFLHALRNAAWGEVARRLAHEIKNPLTPIQLATEHLRRKCLPGMTGVEGEVLERATTTIINQVKSMQGMVDAFSEYARSPMLRLSLVDGANLVREVAELYRGRTDVTIKLRITPQRVPVRADAARLRQVLHNLIKNAIEAQEGAARPAWVEIAIAALPGGGMELRVGDRGPGFSPALLTRAFEPYVTTKRGGTGLGLALVHKLVEEQGGRVWLGNRPGGGAQVVVRLAQARSEQEEQV